MLLSKDKKYNDFLAEYASYEKYVKSNTAEVAALAGITIDVWRNVFSGKTKTPSTLDKIILACRKFMIDGARCVPNTKVLTEVAA